MTRWCPACRRGWPDERAVCAECLASLVDELDATVRCRHCDRAWPSRMQSCPNCLGELRTDPDAQGEALARVLASGRHLPRPADRRPFAGGPACTLLRTAPRSSLLYVGPDELLEAAVTGADHRAVPPLRCHDVDGALLFRLVRYEAAAGALVAMAADGAPLATYLRRDGGLDVRDETSAPVGRLRPAPGGYALVETGGEELASVLVADIEMGPEASRMVDDQWTLTAGGSLPLRPLAAVALLLAGKVLLGRTAPAVVTSETVT